MLSIISQIVFLLAIQTADNIAASEVAVTQPPSIDTCSLIEETDKKIADTDNGLSNYKEVKRNLEGQSSEGGVIAAYYDKDTLKKIETSFYGEMGKAVTEYYWDENFLLFVRSTLWHYNRPIYLDNSEVKSMEENLYYFYNKDLALWRSSKSQFFDPESNEFKNENQYLLKTAEEFRNLVEED